VTSTGENSNFLDDMKNLVFQNNQKINLCGVLNKKIIFVNLAGNSVNTQ
jgi:hypothetical protein